MTSCQLSGEQLSAVTFVQDYLQLWFDGPGINVLNPVTIYLEDRSARSWDAQFRNSLCSQIAKIVASVTVHEGTALKITFAKLPRAMMWPEGTHGNQDDHNL